MKILLYILLATSSLTGLMAQSDDFYEISRLPFTNDRTDDFAPAYFRDGIVFTTNRRSGAFIERLTEMMKYFIIFSIPPKDQESGIIPVFLPKT
jgi:hypothetical protein